MIIQITSDNISDILPIIRFKASQIDKGDEWVDSMFARTKGAISGGWIGYCYLEAGNPLGFIMANPGSGMIGILETTNEGKASDGIKIKLLEQVRIDLQGLNRSIIASREDLPLSLVQELKKENYEEYERVDMLITPENVAPLQYKVNPEFRISPFEDEMLDYLIPLVVQVTGGSIDGEIYPLFRTEEGSGRYVRRILEDKRYSQLLFEKDNLIGYCLISEEDAGIFEISIMGVDPSYRGKGLGKNLLVYTMKNLVEKEKELKGFTLTVTVNNVPAYPMYLKLGFEVSERTDIICKPLR